MSRFVIEGGSKLYGNVKIQSAKNCLLPLISACIMLECEVTFLNVSMLKDVSCLLEIIKSLGGSFTYQDGNLKIDCSNLTSYILPENLVNQARAPLFMLGPLLTRFKKAEFTMPGGCKLGERPIDIHLVGLQKLGVKIEENEVIKCTTKKLEGSSIVLTFPSVGATLNLIMASVTADGYTVIKNSAKEPEIVCLCKFLNLMGAKIDGIGTDVIQIEGVKSLKKKSVEFAPIPDRIETGTFILSVLSTGGELTIENANYSHNQSLIKKIFNNTCKICIFNDRIYIKSSGIGKGLGQVNILPYPGFPTDLQSPLLAYSTTLKGQTIIKEHVFKDRFLTAFELNKMGANIKIDGNIASVNGVETLHGNFVTATDLRGGAGLIIASLKAQGVTVIDNAEILDRGYYQIEEKFKNIGANIKRVL